MGKIRFLGDAGAFKLRTAREAEAELRKMGFTNVRCEGMQDICENILNLDEKVASVTVDGGPS